MTTNLFWLASASSFLISLELLALAVNTKTIILAARIALTICSWKFWPGFTSRAEIQQERPRFSSAAQMVRATL